MALLIEIELIGIIKKGKLDRNLKNVLYFKANPYLKYIENINVTKKIKINKVIPKIIKI